MSMYQDDYEVFSHQIQSCLKKHFHSSIESQVIAETDAIYQSWRASKALQEKSRTNKNPNEDIRWLEKAAKHVSHAANAVRKVGWYGGKAIDEQQLEKALTKEDELLVARYKREMAKISSKNNSQKGRYVELPSPNDQQDNLKPTKSFQNLQKVEDLAAELDIMCSRLIEVANSVCKDATLIPKSNFRPTEDTAYFVCKLCSKCFETLSGMKATVRTRFDDNSAYGPFLDFVSDIFDVLLIKASAETFSRMVCAELSARTAT